MTNEFIRKAFSAGIIDTKKYRYLTVACCTYDTQYLELRRIPLEHIGTTACLDSNNWDVIARKY